MQNYINQKQIDKIFELAIDAGKIAKSGFVSQDFKIYTKSDNSRVSSIDIEISQFLSKKLSIIFPDIPIVCEEGKTRYFENEIFFLIDPIDGTSSFINNSPAFCINIALIKNRKPIFGMIYAPLFEGGKMMINNEENQVVLVNIAKSSKSIVYVDSHSKMEGVKIVSSPRTKEEEIESFVSQNFPEHLKNYKVERLSSAVKFFRIIEGEANIYLHNRRSMEWDTASGHALIKSLDYKLYTIEYKDKIFYRGDELLYKKNNFINSGFVILT